MRARAGHTLGDDALLSLGLDFAVNARFYNDQFWFFNVGGVAVVDALRYTALNGAEEWGWRAGLGLETGPGLLWFLDPYLFGETAGYIGFDYTQIGDLGGWGISGRFSVRFDWAIRKDPTSDWYEEEVKDLYKLIPDD